MEEQGMFWEEWMECQYQHEILRIEHWEPIMLRNAQQNWLGEEAADYILVLEIQYHPYSWLIVCTKYI